MPTSWSDIDNYRVAGLGGAADLNLLRTNLDFLAEPPLAYYQHSTTGGNYVTTAVQLMVPIDPVNMALEVTTSGGVLVCIFEAMVTRVTAFPAISYDIDGQQVYRDGTGARQAGFNGGAAERPWSLIMPLFGIPAGEHVVQPIWAGDVAGTSTIIDDYAPFFGVWEI